MFRFVGKRAELVAQAVEVRGFFDAAENFLSDGTNHRDPPILNQQRELGSDRFVARMALVA